MNERKPNEELVNRSKELEIQAIKHLKANELNESYNLYEKMLKDILKSQEKGRKRIYTCLKEKSCCYGCL